MFHSVCINLLSHNIIILIQTLVGLVLLRFLNLLTPWLVIWAQVLVELTFFISCLATPSKTSILKYVCCVINKSSTIPQVYIGYELAIIISYSTSTSETIIVYICKDAPKYWKLRSKIKIPKTVWRTLIIFVEHMAYIPTEG